jgi:MFS transporter, FHS family, L-fucose permease
MQELGAGEAAASSYYIAALILFTLLRFVFTALMKYFSPGKLLGFSATCAVIFTLFTIMGSGNMAVYALVAISAFMSLMFPTIYGLSLKGLGGDTKIGASGLIMAILGGAVITAIQGQVSDISGSIKLAFIVPLVCFLIIAAYGFWNIRMEKLPAAV